MIAILATCTVLIGLAVLYDIVRDPERPPRVPQWAARNGSRSGKATGSRSGRATGSRSGEGAGSRSGKGAKAATVRRHPAAPRVGNGVGQQRFRPQTGGPSGRNERRGMVEKPADKAGLGERAAAEAHRAAPAPRPPACDAAGCAWPTCWDSAPQEGCVVLTNSTGTAAQD